MKLCGGQIKETQTLEVMWWANIETQILEVMWWANIETQILEVMWWANKRNTDT